MPTIIEIIKEIKTTLNQKVTANLNKEEVEQIILQTLKTALSKVIAGSTEYNKLRKQLQLLLAQDILQSSTEPFAIVLKKHPNWLSLPQTILNTMTTTPEQQKAKQDNHKVIFSKRDRILDFCIAAWGKWGVNPSYIRRGNFIIFLGLYGSISGGAQAILPLIPQIGLTLGIVTSYFFSSVFWKNTQSILKDTLNQFKTDYPQHVASVKADYIKLLRRQTYEQGCLGLELFATSGASIESFNNQKEAFWEHCFNTEDEGFLATKKAHFVKIKSGNFEKEFDERVDRAILDTGFNRIVITATAFYRAIVRPLEPNEGKVKPLLTKALLVASATVVLPSVLIIDLVVKIGHPLLTTLFPAIVEKMAIGIVLLFSLPVISLNSIITLKDWLMKPKSNNAQAPAPTPAYTPTPQAAPKPGPVPTGIYPSPLAKPKNTLASNTNPNPNPIPSLAGLD